MLILTKIYLTFQGVWTSSKYVVYHFSRKISFFQRLIKIFAVILEQQNLYVVCETPSFSWQFEIPVILLEFVKP